MRPSKEEVGAALTRLTTPGTCCGPECEAQWPGMVLAAEVLALRQDLAEARAKAFEEAADEIQDSLGNDVLAIRFRRWAKAAREAK